MTDNNKNPKVDEFIDREEHWKDEFVQLRSIILDCHLTEDFKWGKPSYSSMDNNIVIVQGFKNYCALLFVKGALLKDKDKILIRQTENVQAARQIRFTGVQEIIELESVIIDYIKEAVEVEKAGLKVDIIKNTEMTIPDEFQSKLNENPALKTAFEALTPGRQRAYILHFSAPKQSKTRESRIEKCMPQILAGRGLND